MKRMIALLLCVAALLALAACGEKAAAPDEHAETGTADEETAATVGGWKRPDSPVVTEELCAKLEKALDGLVGARYTPVAYLGSQLVNGTNYALLCRVAPVVPDPVETYAIVHLYETLDGEVSITDVLESGKETGLNGMMGSWTESESLEVPEDVKTSLEKAVEGKLGAAYAPVALLSTQLVSGTNYCLLCEVTPVVPNPESSYVLVYLYVNLDGNAELTETVEFVSQNAEG